MANPRKFSEKIALHNHRQAEETARFEQIMKEVSDATARPEDCPLTHTNMVAQSHRESRARSQGGPIRRPQDRKHDTSPYSTGPFLSPPPDTSWRRTNSDSALHQSAMQGMANDRNDNSGNRWMMQSMNGQEQHDGRPRSSCEVPRVPGISIYPSVQEPGIIQIPIGNNTGSLPDLTSVHFPSPIPTPLDHDGDQGSSPYSSSPVNTSPSTLSPTSLQHGMRQQSRCFQFVNQTSPHHQQNLLLVPNSRYHPQPVKNMPMDKNVTGIDSIDYSQLTGLNMFQQPQKVPPSSPSPTLQQASYRSPRPSPQSSPGLGHHSAPCSPGAPSPLPSDYQLFSQAQLQQHFEQFSMVDTPNNVSYIDQSQMTHPQSFNDVSGAGSVDPLTNDGGYYSTSPQFAYPAASPSLHTTPNTPTSIPDIILTDFSAGDELNSKDSLALTRHLDMLDNEQSNRLLDCSGLEPLDFDSIQILSESGMSMIPDSVEDHFRLDRS